MDNFLSFNCVFSRIWQFLAGTWNCDNGIMKTGMAVFNFQKTLDTIDPEAQEKLLDEEEVDGPFMKN